ncbi:helicase associated domain-containing protein [Seiridium cupressi]
MSALGDAASFCNYFGSAPLLRIEGRRYQVEDHYLVGHTSFNDRPGQSEDLQLWATPMYLDCAIRTMLFIHENIGAENIVLFLTGEEEIEEAVDTLSKESTSFESIPLYASLT